jgi:hypothetical protein
MAGRVGRSRFIEPGVAILNTLRPTANCLSGEGRRLVARVRAKALK